MPRKLDPGLAQTYSNPRDLITSTMKSDPVRSAVRTSAFEGVPVSASGDMGGGTVLTSSTCCCAATVPGAAAKAAAPAAALFRKFRRSTANFFGLITAIHLYLAFTYIITRSKQAATGRGVFEGAVALAEHCTSAPLTLLLPRAMLNLEL